MEMKHFGNVLNQKNNMEDGDEIFITNASGFTLQF